MATCCCCWNCEIDKPPILEENPFSEYEMIVVIMNMMMMVMIMDMMMMVMIMVVDGIFSEILLDAVVMANEVVIIIVVAIMVIL